MSCTRVLPACNRLEIPGADESVTPSHPTEARGTAKASAVVEMIVLCMAFEKVDTDVPEKIKDRRNRALPVDGVTSVELDCVGVADSVDESVGEIETVDDGVGVNVGEGVPEGVIEGVGESSHTYPEPQIAAGLPHSTEPPKPEDLAVAPALVQVAVAPDIVVSV